MESTDEVLQLAKTNYDKELEACIRGGLPEKVLRSGIFDAEQLRQIRIGIIDGIDVLSYFDAKYSWYEMK